MSIRALVPSAPSGRLRGSIRAVGSLTAADRDAMWAVFARYYAAVDRPRFEADLSTKDDVIFLEDSGDRSLQGFTTIEVYSRRIEGRPFVAVYSGDTVVEEAYWGQSALQRTFFRYLMTTKLRNPTRPVYWYLISKGYKTYLLLARNVPHHFPRWDAPTPAFDRCVLDLLSTDKFGAAYRPEQGVLHFPECQGRLKRGVAPIDTSLLGHADIRFFVNHNPGHADGDELCCLGRIDAALPAHFVVKQLERSLARGLRRARERLWAGSS